MRGAVADEVHSEGHLRLQNMCIAMSSGEKLAARMRGHCLVSLRLLLQRIATEAIPTSPKTAKLKRQVLCNAGHLGEKKRPYA